MKDQIDTWLELANQALEANDPLLAREYFEKILHIENTVVANLGYIKSFLIEPVETISSKSLGIANASIELALQLLNKNKELFIENVAVLLLEEIPTLYTKAKKHYESLDDKIQGKNKLKELSKGIAMLLSSFRENTGYQKDSFLKEGTIIFNRLYADLQDDMILFCKEKFENKKQFTSHNTTPLQREKQDNSKNCFIVTAATGSDNNNVVIYFRKFRDDFLLKNRLGSIFVEYYYKYAPTIAKRISKSEILKKTVFYVLLIPLYTIIRVVERLYIVLKRSAICKEEIF